MSFTLKISSNKIPAIVEFLSNLFSNEGAVTRNTKLEIKVQKNGLKIRFNNIFPDFNLFVP
jgi:hypothetical protein